MALTEHKAFHVSEEAQAVHATAAGPAFKEEVKGEVEARRAVIQTELGDSERSCPWGSSGRSSWKRSLWVARKRKKNLRQRVRRQKEEILGGEGGVGGGKAGGSTFGFSSKQQTLVEGLLRASHPWSVYG